MPIWNNRPQIRFQAAFFGANAFNTSKECWDNPRRKGNMSSSQKVTKKTQESQSRRIRKFMSDGGSPPCLWL